MFIVQTAHPRFEHRYSDVYATGWWQNSQSSLVYQPTHESGGA